MTAVPRRLAGRATLGCYAARLAEARPVGAAGRASRPALIARPWLRDAVDLGALGHAVLAVGMLEVNRGRAAEALARGARVLAGVFPRIS